MCICIGRSASVEGSVSPELNPDQCLV